MSTRSTAAAAAAAAAIASVRSRGRGHKERSKNFTELEKRTVLELIAQHRDVLKQGRSNNATNKNKQLVWSTICAEVNKRCSSDRPRTPAQVKMWYENYKKKCKMRATEYQEGGSLLDGMLWQTIHPLDIKDEEPDMKVKPDDSIPEDELPVNMSNGRLSYSESSDPISNMLEPQVQIIPQSPTTSPPPQSHIKAALQQPPCTATCNSISPPSHVPGLTQNPTIHQNLPPPELLRLKQVIPLLPSGNGPCLMPEPAGPLNLSHLDHSESSDVRRNSTECVGADNRKAVINQRLQSTSNRCTLNADPANASCKRNSWSEGNNSTKTTAEPYQESGPTEEEKLYFMAKRQHAIWEHEAKMKILNMELRQKEEIFTLQKQLFLIELKLKMDFLEKNCSK